MTLQQDGDDPYLTPTSPAPEIDEPIPPAIPRAPQERFSLAVCLRDAWGAYRGEFFLCLAGNLVLAALLIPLFMGAVLVEILTDQVVRFEAPILGIQSGEWASIAFVFVLSPLFLEGAVKFHLELLDRRPEMDHLLAGLELSTQEYTERLGLCFLLLVVVGLFVVAESSFQSAAPVWLEGQFSSRAVAESVAVRMGTFTGLLFLVTTPTLLWSLPFVVERKLDPTQALGKAISIGGRQWFRSMALLVLSVAALAASYSVCVLPALITAPLVLVANLSAYRQRVGTPGFRPGNKLSG